MNAFFCYSDGLLSPCSKSVVDHGSAGKTHVSAGSTLLEAAEAVKRAAGVASDCAVSFLDRGRWVRIRNGVTATLVRPDETYFFRIVPAEAHKPACFAPSPPPLLKGVVLHQTIAHGMNGEQRELEFMRFKARSSTEGLCRKMMDFLITATSSSSSSEQQEQICREFHHLFALRLFFPNSFRLQQTGVVLLGKQYFLITISSREFSGQSGQLALSSDDETSLEELGFVFWMAQLQNIKPAVSVHQRMIVVDGAGGVRVEALSPDLKPTATSNTVLKVRKLDDGDGGELILKVGHSLTAKQLSEELCVQLRDQVANEAAILAKLQRSSLAPQLVRAGYWDDRPVILTELRGSALPDEPIDPAVAEQMCRDLTGIVLHLFCDYGIAHTDISLSNIGVFFEPEAHTGRRFYLFDFGYAVEVKEQQRERKRCPVNLLFSSGQAVRSSGRSVGLVSELTSVAYVCLYLATGCSLPWLHAAQERDVEACCELREQYAINLRDKPGLLLHCLGPGMQDWIRFLVSQQAPVQDAEVAKAARAFLDIV